MTIGNRKKPSRRALFATAALAGALLLGACGSQTPPDNAGGGETTVNIEDAWVKAAEDGMTAVFGTVNNPTGTDITITAAKCELSPMELHEMVMSDGEMVMRQKEDGIVVPAGGSHSLEPGGDHLMLMDISEPVQAGDEITVTLAFGDDESLSFTAVAKDFAGGNEEYVGDGDDHSEMES